jgi:hypothetical protein
MNFLTQPYPFEFHFKKDLFRHFSVGFAIGLFLIVFQPFGAWQWHNTYKIVHFSMFGAISFLVSFSFSWAFHSLFLSLEDNWKVWKQICFIMSFVFLILFFSFLYTLAIGTNTFGLSAFLLFCLYGFFISLVPVTVNIFYMYKKFQAAHQKEAVIMNQKLDDRNDSEEVELPNETSSSPTLLFTAENGKDTLALDGACILFIQSSDNYSEIKHLHDSRIQNTLLRSSLKRLEGQITVPYLIRCHRSAIVNLNRVKHIQGNAQGYKISFDGTNDTVPVSRNFSAAILSGLEGLKKV